MDRHMIPLESIRIDGGTQIRLEIRTDVVQEYAELIAKLPPISVFFDGSNYWLADGFHRYHAARMAGNAMIEAEVTNGTLDDARWFAASANKGHGLRRTNPDKHKAVVEALKMRPEMSDRAIADHVGVSNKMVSLVRAKLDATVKITQSSDRVGRDGRTINTTNIGKSATVDAAALPSDQEDPDAARTSTTGDARPRVHKSSRDAPPSRLDSYPAIKALLKRLYDLSGYRDEQLSALAVREIAKQLTLELAKVL